MSDPVCLYNPELHDLPATLVAPVPIRLEVNESSYGAISDPGYLNYREPHDISSDIDASVPIRLTVNAVSYTHLTLPTKRIV